MIPDRPRIERGRALRIGLAGPDERPAAGSPGGLAARASGLLTGRWGAWLFTVALTVAAVAVFVVLIVPAPAYDATDMLPWPFFAVAFLVSEIAVVHLVAMNQAVTVSLSEIPLVVGFYFLAPAYLIVAQFVGSAIALVVHRRQPPVKLIFNLAIFSLGSSLALLVFRQIAPLAPTNLLVWWMASFAGSGTVVVTSAVAISIVISITQHRLELSSLRRGILVGLAAAFVNTAVALTAVVFLRSEPSLLWLLAAPALVGLLGYRAFGAQRKRQARLEFLFDCSLILSGPLLDTATLARLLQRTQEMFRAGSVEVILADAGGKVNPTRTLLEHGSEPVTEAIVPTVLEARRQLLGPGGASQLLANDRMAGGADRGRHEAMIVAVDSPSGTSGTILVAGRLDDLEPFGNEDLRVLEVLGSRLALVAENSGLVGRLATSLDDVSKLAAIVESSEDAIVAVNNDGRIGAWNAAAERLFGYSAEAMLGHLASEVLPEGDGAALSSSFTAVFAGAAVNNLRRDGQHADGTSIPVSITISPVRSAGGTITGASAIVRDERDRVRAEAAAAASAEQLRVVIEGSPLGMGTAGADHRWIQANPALCAMLGLSPSETIGRPVADMIHPDDLAPIGRLEERIFAGEITDRVEERRYVNREGRVVWTQVTARLIKDPTSEQPVALYTIEDITARRRAADQARSSEERFRRAALAISAIQDPDRVLHATLVSARETLSARYAAIATYSEDGSELIAMDVDGIENRDDMLQKLGHYPNGTGILGLARALRRPVRLRDLTSHPSFGGFPEGHPAMTSFMAVPIAQDRPGRSTLYLANKIDADEFTEADMAIAVALATHASVCLENARVNARARELVIELDRANLDLVEANHAKSRFLASVAHELRTPLHAILVAAELVHDPPLGPLPAMTVQQLGGTIESSGRHMVRLIDDLVDLARIEAGRLDLRTVPVAIGDVLAEIEGSLGRVAQEKQITLEFPEGPGPTVEADPVRVRQILTNLVTNAIKFTEPGGQISVEMSSTRSTTRIVVRDTGIGIAQEDIERAFLPFEQVSRTNAPGSGLGLAISRSLAELHGGRLEATSTPGSGSAFTLTLPRKSHRVPASKSPVPSASKLPAPFYGEGRPIMVVEDDPTAMGLAADLLRMADYEVWQAEGITEAVERLEQGRPALILLDLRLRDGNGIELASRVRADPATADVPILVLSADTTAEDLRRAREAGCDDFLSKPASPRALLSKIDELIRGAARQRANEEVVEMGESRTPRPEPFA